MKKAKILAITLILGMTACEEFQPVFTGTYKNPEYVQPVDMDNDVNKTIAEIKDLYAANKNKPVTIDEDFIIKGKVTTSDQQGNLYKSLYIQDGTAGIELKLGKNGLYNEYKVGQWIYVRCMGLTVGDYSGMLQIGANDPTGEYETAYIEHQYIIDTHIFKGEYDEPEKPVVVTESELKNKKNLGRLVTIKDLTYDNAVFVIIYINPNLPGDAKKAGNNRVFMDEEVGHNWGIDSWAMSESLFKTYLEAGKFDEAELQDGSKKISEYRKPDGTYDIIPAAYTLSQYFKMGKTPVQVRTSGYCRFSDTLIDEDVRAGRKKVDLTGILTQYDGQPQFTLIDLDGVYVHE